MIIAVDFDGTLFEKVKPYTGLVGKPIMPMIRAIRAAKKRGHSILIYTCRSGAGRVAAAAALTEHKIRYDGLNEEVTDNQDGVWWDNGMWWCAPETFQALKPRGIPCRKPAFDILVDDKALGWRGPVEAAKKLRRFIDGKPRGKVKAL